MKQSLYPTLFIIITLLLINGCGQPTQEPAPSTAKTQKTPMVTVSILPQQHFLQRIGGDNFQVHVMIPPGHNPATYEPTPQQMKAVSQSVIYFRIGHIPFEKAWMDKIVSNNKNMTVVDTSKGVSLITGMPAHSHGEPEESKEHRHDHEAEHDDHHHHGGTDPHIWLSPAAVKIQARHIYDALANTDPANKSLYQNNYNSFISDIDTLDTEMETILAPLKGTKFMVFHPAWSYLARDYGLVQFPIEIEGKEPGVATLKRVIDTAKKENIQVIFVQKQFSAAAAQTVASEIGGRVIAMDPLAPNWLKNMKTIAQTFKETLTK